jgi:small subunit ribosomal protein S6
MPETVRLYELVYIIAPDRSEEQVQGVIEKYNNLITTQGGTVDKTDIWERRRLAYEINGYSEGLYVVTIFRAVPAVEAELRRVFRISEDTLRSIIVRPDEETPLPEPVPMPAPRGQVDEGAPRRGPRAPAAERRPEVEAVAEPVEEPVAKPEADTEEAPVAEAAPEPEAKAEPEHVETTA